MPALIFKIIFENKIEVPVNAAVERMMNNSGGIAALNSMQAKPDMELWSMLFGISALKNTDRIFDTSVKNQEQSLADISNYELLGTVTGNKSSARACVLIKNSGKKLFLHIGDNLDLYKLISIQRFFAEFQSPDKKKIILKTPSQNKPDSSNKLKTVSIEPRKNIQEPDKYARPAQPLEHSEEDKKNINLTRDEINNLLYNELETILTTTNIVPYFKESKMIGIRINKMSGTSALTKYFGLKLNDVITSVNGRPIDSVEKGMKLWDNMKTENQLNLNLIRNGEYLNFNFNIR